MSLHTEGMLETHYTVAKSQQYAQVKFKNYVVPMYFKQSAQCKLETDSNNKLWWWIDISNNVVCS